MRNRGKCRVLYIKPQPDHYLENTKPFRAILMGIVLCEGLKTAKIMVSTVVSTVCINHLLKCHACLLAYIFNETDKLNIYHYKTDFLSREGGFWALKTTITVKHRPSWYYLLLR